MFRSPLPTTFSAQRPIYVNQYALSSEEASERDLLRIARSAAGRDTPWIGRNATFRDTLPRVAPTTSFELTPGAPRSNTKRSPPQLKEWNAGVNADEDDVFNIDELEEFKSTDLSFLMLKRPHLEEPVDEPPLKRRRLDMASLGNVIPQPHVLPSPATASTKTKAVPAYSRTKPIPIAPHTLPLPAPPPFSRRSWVIPVRGALPWRHATSAALLLDATEPPQPPDPKTHEEITWSVPALREFWDFLLSMREIHAFGLSFNVSQVWSSNSQATYEFSGIGAQPRSVSSAAPSSVASSSRQGIGIMPLTFVDHIKVYHDAPHSMSIRNIIDVWPFEPGGRKIRLLKGARLVLLDERSKGILVS